MHPGLIAVAQPNKIAYVMADSGQAVTYKELNDDSCRVAQLFRSRGLQWGDHIALMLENHAIFHKICWGAQRSGLYYTAISWRLQQPEVAYIVANCEAKVFISSYGRKDVVAPLAEQLRAAGVACFMVDGTVPGFESLEEALAKMPTAPIADEAEGTSMLYSSGTTGYPKGVNRPLERVGFGEGVAAAHLKNLYNATEDSVYLSPAPLYHAAPLGFTMGCLRFGTTVIVMEQFDPERALQYIEQFKVTHSQWVPTMFVRMLKLPEDVRRKYDLSSLQVAVHAAAPCPMSVKEQMISWWGPVLHEYYAGTEGNGFVKCDSTEWLAHKGTVGKALNCVVRICDDEGNELPVRETGTIYFEGGGKFEYYKDPEKTRASQHPQGWTTLGDVGYLDDDGFLYLTDRKHFMIISGGVNIYPQEAENVLIGHPKVVDVAVFGVPNEEFGEEVKAVVQLADMNDAGAALEQTLIAYCRSHIAALKCPRSIDFDAELPRHPTGKLYKRLLKDRYWEGHNKRIG